MNETPLFRIATRVLLTVLALTTLLPLWVMVSGALRPLPEVLAGFAWLPEPFTPDAFVEMWRSVPLARYLGNSLLVASLSTALSVLVAVLAAYALSRFRFRGRTAFAASIVGTQMFPGVLFLVPLFLVLLWLQGVLGVQLIGTTAALVLTYLTFALPFSIMLLRAYFDTVPRELDEAASLDGAGPVRTLFAIVLPASVPGLIAVTVFTFILAWSEVLFASVLTGADSATLAIGLRGYLGTSSAIARWNELMAASIVVSAPVVVGFLVLQRHLVAGFTAGAVR